MKYFYIAFQSPFGNGSYFYRDEKHPLDPVTHKDRTVKLAKQLEIQNKVIVFPESIVYLAVIELPTEVAQARWPEDF